MPTYTLACPSCGDIETIVPISRAELVMACPQCERPRPQLFHPPQFQEDRVRFFKGSLQNGYSFALGAQMPDSRQARDRLAKQKGVEFTSVADLRRDNREADDALAYREHVDTGGTKTEVKPVDMSSFVTKPTWAEGLGVK